MEAAAKAAGQIVGFLPDPDANATDSGDSGGGEPAGPSVAPSAGSARRKLVGDPAAFAVGPALPVASAMLLERARAVAERWCRAAASAFGKLQFGLVAGGRLVGGAWNQRMHRGGERWL